MELGALQLSTKVAGLSGAIPTVPFRHDILSATKDLSGKRKQITATTKIEPVFRLAAGDYHVVARLGNQNVISETDVSVPAGQLSELAIEQQAAFVTIAVDGKPEGRIRWDVYDSNGKSIAATVRPEISVVLAPGEYEAKLSAGDKTASETFTVASGEAKDIRIAPPQ